MGAILPFPRGERNNFSGGNYFDISIGIFRKNTSKYAKLIVESYMYDNVNQIHHFLFHFSQKNFEIHLVKKSSGRQQIDFFLTCMITLCWY